MTQPSSSHRSSSTDSTIKQETSPVVSNDDPQTGAENRDAANSGGQTTLIIGSLVGVICVLVLVVIVGIVMWCRKTKKPQRGYSCKHVYNFLISFALVVFGLYFKQVVYKMCLFLKLSENYIYYL